MTQSKAAPLLLAIGSCLGIASLGAQTGVIDTVHNLSVSGPGQIRSLTETEVCKFCHIPHNAIVPEPLWGHALSEVQSYDVAVQRLGDSLLPAPQPDGASRLCLSCHDGTVALGDVAGRATIPVSGAQTLAPGNRGFIGTDLSGSHPISFVIGDRPQWQEGADMGQRSLAEILADKDVRLDEQGKMQCTTCHDPHRDRFYVEGRVPRFWVKPTVDEVCLVCHEVR